MNDALRSKITPPICDIILENFEVRDFPYPFKVILLNGVKMRNAIDGQQECYFIPNAKDLPASVMFSRLLHPKRLTGGELRFARAVLRLRQSQVAAAIGIAPETLSRFETKALPLGTGTEKLLRLFLIRVALDFFEIETGLAGRVTTESFSLVFDKMNNPSAANNQEDITLKFALRDGQWFRVLDSQYVSYY